MSGFWNEIGIIPFIIINGALFVIYSYLLRRHLASSQKIYIYDFCVGAAAIFPVMFSSLPVVIGSCFLVVLLFGLLCLSFPQISPWWKFLSRLNKITLFCLLLFFVFCLFMENVGIEKILLLFGLFYFGIFFIIFMGCLRRQNIDYAQRHWSFFVGQIYFNIYYIFVVLIALAISVIFISSLFLMLTDPQKISEERCLDIGYCPQGTVLDNCFDDGKNCVIDKQNCIKLQGNWLTDFNVCKFSK